MLRLRGCNEIHVRELGSQEDKNFAVTEEGILSYCFTRDHDLPVPERRSLGISWPASITPAFFEKIVEASRNSHLTCDVELYLTHLRFDVGNLGLGVQPTRSRTEYEYEIYMQNVRYNIADHGNGLHFTSKDGGEDWDMTARHGKKDRTEFFQDDAELNEEHEPELEGSDRDE
ncbi:hypothetical protein AAVH_37082 [Aphelenchoides avenae]|nr:hypothetical protein AAVH_37082 [Aphelenchus avenae]